MNEPDMDMMKALVRRECDDADAILRAAGLDPETYRTEGGNLNLPKIRAALAQRPKDDQAIPAPWGDLVEERLHQWRQRTMNLDGDMLALDDFMSAETIDDLIDFVCAPVPCELWPSYTAEQMTARYLEGYRTATDDQAALRGNTPIPWEFIEQAWRLTLVGATGCSRSEAEHVIAQSLESATALVAIADTQPSSHGSEP